MTRQGDLASVRASMARMAEAQTAFCKDFEEERRKYKTASMQHEPVNVKRADMLQPSSTTETESALQRQLADIQAKVSSQHLVEQELRDQVAKLRVELCLLSARQVDSKDIDPHSNALGGLSCHDETICHVQPVDRTTPIQVDSSRSSATLKIDLHQEKFGDLGKVLSQAGASTVQQEYAHQEQLLTRRVAEAVAAEQAKHEEREALWNLQHEETLGMLQEVMQQEVEQYKQQLDEAHSKLDAESEQRKGLESELAALQAQLSQAQRDQVCITALHGQVQELEFKLSSQALEHAKLAQQNSKLQEQLTKSESESSWLGGQVIQVNEKLSVASKECVDLKQKVEKLSSQYAAAVKELGRYKAHIQVRDKKLEQLNNDKKALQQEVQTLHEGLQAAKDDARHKDHACKLPLEAVSRLEVEVERRCQDAENAEKLSATVRWLLSQRDGLQERATQAEARVSEMQARAENVAKALLTGAVPELSSSGGVSACVELPRGAKNAGSKATAMQRPENGSSRSNSTAARLIVELDGASVRQQQGGTDVHVKGVLAGLKLVAASQHETANTSKQTNDVSRVVCTVQNEGTVRAFTLKSKSSSTDNNTSGDHVMRDTHSNGLQCEPIIHMMGSGVKEEAQCGAAGIPALPCISGGDPPNCMRVSSAVSADIHMTTAVKSDAPSVVVEASQKLSRQRGLKRPATSLPDPHTQETVTAAQQPSSKKLNPCSGVHVDSIACDDRNTGANSSDTHAAGAASTKHIKVIATTATDYPSSVDNFAPGTTGESLPCRAADAASDVCAGKRVLSSDAGTVRFHTFPREWVMAAKALAHSAIGVFAECLFPGGTPQDVARRWIIINKFSQRGRLSASSEWWEEFGSAHPDVAAQLQSMYDDLTDASKKDHCSNGGGTDPVLGQHADAATSGSGVAADVRTGYMTNPLDVVMGDDQVFFRKLKSNYRTQTSQYAYGVYQDVAISRVIQGWKDAGQDAPEAVRHFPQQMESVGNIMLPGKVLNPGYTAAAGPYGYHPTASTTGAAMYTAAAPYPVPLYYQKMHHMPAGYSGSVVNLNAHYLAYPVHHTTTACEGVQQPADGAHAVYDVVPAAQPAPSVAPPGAASTEEPSPS